MKNILVNYLRIREVIISQNKIFIKTKSAFTYFDEVSKTLKNHKSDSVELINCNELRMLQRTTKD